MKVLFYLFLTFILIYFTFIFFWYLYPARIFGIKYNVVSSLKLNDFNKGPYLFVVDHTEPSNTDIMIMSEELHNCLEPEKFKNVIWDS